MRQLLDADEVAICRQNRSKGHRLAPCGKEATASQHACELEENFSLIAVVGDVADVIRQEVTVGARHRFSPGVEARIPGSKWPRQAPGEALYFRSHVTESKRCRGPTPQLLPDLDMLAMKGLGVDPMSCAMT